MTVSALPGAGDLDLTDRASFDHWTREVLRFGDTDAFGHINNGAYVACFENGRIKLLRRVGVEEGEGSVDWVLARLCVDYHAQLHYPGEVDVGTRITRVGQSSLSAVQALFREGTCCGSATAVLVLVDLDSGRAAPIPEAMRARFEDERR